nr:hypothetical protein CFP56_67151 [Quercus suber]
MGIYSACSPPLSVFFAVGVAGFGSGEIGAWVRRRLGRGLVNRRLGSSAPRFVGGFFCHKSPGFVGGFFNTSFNRR